MGKSSAALTKVIALALVLNSFTPAVSRAEDRIEEAGVAVGVTAGNLWLIPIKAISVMNGMLTGALSFIVTGGNVNLTQQIWQDTMEPAYVITPEVARKAIGERPELSTSE